MHHRLNARCKADRLGELGEFLEGIPKQDEGHDFELLAERFGKRSGNGEDKLHHLHAEDERKGQMDRRKVAHGLDGRQPRRQHSLPVGLNTHKSRKIDEEDHRSERTLGSPVIPQLMDDIKQMGNRFAFLNHWLRLYSKWLPGKSIRRTGFRPANAPGIKKPICVHAP